MRFYISLCIMVLLITSGCDTSPSSSQISLTMIPTTTVVPQLSDTPTSDPTVTKESKEASPTLNTAKTAANAIAPFATVIFCTKQLTWQRYIVEAGDTLGNIAQRGNTVVDTLVNANCLTDARPLNIGQVLYVPSAIAPRPADNNEHNIPPPTANPNGYTTELWWLIDGDGGNTGFPAGCGSSIYLRESGIPTDLPIDEKLRRALAYLTDENNVSEKIGGHGWWNALSSTTLTLDSYIIEDDHVTIYLLGVLNLSGVCVDAEVEPQLVLNIMTLTNTRRATIYVGGENIRRTFDMSAMDTRDEYIWEEFSEVRLIEYWIISSIEESDKAIDVGCGSYIVPRKTPTTVSDDTLADLNTALRWLMTASPTERDGDHISNSYWLDQGLFIEHAEIHDGHADIDIGGVYHEVSDCIDSVLEAQFVQTVFQFDDIQTAKITNGETNFRQFIDTSGKLKVADHIYARSD